MSTIEGTRADSVLEELGHWLGDNWDPDITVGEWWRRLGEAGWAAPMLPVAPWGRATSRDEAVRIHNAILAHGAVPGPLGLGLSLAAPTIVDHGTEEQIQRYVPDIVTGRAAWCQLFSEPGAGSDLASLATRATRDGDIWRVDGQKVWTSSGQIADHGMLLARTDVDAPKHQGITWFALDMHQDGVDVRPLREMTGHAVFNEVFLTDAVVADEARIGDVDNGWAVANTTLRHERSSMGAGVPRPALMPRPGSVAGDLERRVGDFVVPPGAAAHGGGAPAPGSEVPSRAPSAARLHIDLARRFGCNGDPTIRADLVRLHVYGELARLNGERGKAARGSAGTIPGLPNISKLLRADTVRLARDLGLRILGARGTLHAYDEVGQLRLAGEPGGRDAIELVHEALRAQALPIYGGTDQIQRNIVGERVLGLPKEPNDLSRVPFSQLPKNA